MKPIRVGIVGTGYAAQKRAEAIRDDVRAELITVTGNSAETVVEFCRKFQIDSTESWQKLIDRQDLDLIFVCTINCDHGTVARAGLEANKHVVVEYPLALNYRDGEEIVALAKKKNKLLHVEHIELIGGLHLAIKEYIKEIGNVFYARYTTIAPQRNIIPNWKYHREMFGFPLTAALSRINRLTDLFGDVKEISCNNRYWNLSDRNYFTACFCNAQLNFSQGFCANIIYGKGDVFWQVDRTFEISGDRGLLIFEGQKGFLIKDGETIPIPVTSRRGLFAKDTAMVLDYLIENKPLYTTPESSLKALKVANNAKVSSESGGLTQILLQ